MMRQSICDWCGNLVQCITVYPTDEDGLSVEVCQLCLARASDAADADADVWESDE